MESNSEEHVGHEGHITNARARLKRDDTRAETRFRLSAKRTSPFKSAGKSVQSTTGSRGVRISGSNAGYTTFRGSVKSTGYPLHSPVSPSLPLPCVTVCHQVSNALYLYFCLLKIVIILYHQWCQYWWQQSLFEYDLNSKITKGVSNIIL